MKNILCVLSLMCIVFPCYAVLMPDSPTLSYVGMIEKKVGAVVEYRMDNVVANITTKGFFGSKGGIVAYFYWCNDAGTNCTSPAMADIPSRNILAKGSLCPANIQDSLELVKCLHSQITPGMYTAYVPNQLSDGRRGMMCLRYVNNIATTSDSFIFAENDNSCRSSPHTIEWCSMVTP
ncbi:hypothetical protein UXP46_23505, partial [Enterobacter ludwigii]